MFESIHERGLAARTLAQAQPKALRAAVGAGTMVAPDGTEGARRLAERRLARPELLVVDSSYRSPDALLEATEAMPTVRAPHAGGASALALALQGQRVASLHLLCGAVPYALLLGGEVIDPRAENERTHAAIASLRSLFLSKGHDGVSRALMLYGTTFGTGDEGENAVRALANALDVAVAATGDRLERASDRPEWHAKARPEARNVTRSEPVVVDRPDDNDPIARLRQRAAEHRAARAKAVRTPEVASLGTEASPEPIVSKDAEPDIEDRLRETFAEIRRRVIDQRPTKAPPAPRPEPRKPTALAAIPEVRTRQAPAEPKRSRIVRHRADGSPIDGEPKRSEPPAAPVAKTMGDASPANGFEPIIALDPFADPMSALHALPRAEQSAEPKRPELAALADEVQEDATASGAVEQAALEHTIIQAEPDTMPEEPAVCASDDPTAPIADHDHGGALRAFSVEALVRPKPFARDDTIEIGEDITIEFDGPRVCFAVAWDTRIVTATADLTVLGIDEPSRSPLHLLGTVGEGWASLFVEGSLAASVPLRGAGEGRKWPVATSAPSLDGFEGEVSLLRVVPRLIDAGAADALCQATRAGEYGSDHRWVAGTLATTVGEGPAMSAPVQAVPAEASTEPSNEPSAEPSSAPTLDDAQASATDDDAAVEEPVTVAAVKTSETEQDVASTPVPVLDDQTAVVPEASEPSRDTASALSAMGAERRVAPGEALALDLPAIGGCELAEVVRAWPVTMPGWLKLDPLEGIAHGRVPRDHAPGTIALVVTSANNRGSTATVAVTLRIEG